MQRPVEARNPLPLIDLGAFAQTNIAPDVVVIDQSRPSTSRTIDAHVSQLATIRNKRHISDVSTHSSQAKRVTPTKTDEDRVHVSITATAVVQPGNEINKIDLVTERVSYTPRKTVRHLAVIQNASTTAQTVHAVTHHTPTVLISTPPSGNICLNFTK